MHGCDVADVVGLDVEPERAVRLRVVGLGDPAAGEGVERDLGEARRVRVRRVRSGSGGAVGSSGANSSSGSTCSGGTCTCAPTRACVRTGTKWRSVWFCVDLCAVACPVVCDDVRGGDWPCSADEE